MATGNKGRPAVPDSFTAHERFLVEKTEQAIREGGQLEVWMRAGHGGTPETLLSLNREYKLPNRAFGYFGEVDIAGKRCSVMGVRQEVDFGKISGPGDPAERLRDFVLGEFLPRANWTYPDGWRGGFDIVQSLYRTPAGTYGKFGEAECAGCIDWRRLGQDYDWVFLTVRIHDFVMKFGPVTRHMKEAACVAMHGSFVHVTEKPAPGIVLEVAVGYPFVEVAPIYVPWGFGPGKFVNACKLYAFQLTDTRELKVQMDFAAAPRCSKVFDVARFVPDPVYGGAAVLQALTFGAWKAQPLHDKLDMGMVSQHGRVHQALMEGTVKNWNDWMSGGSR